MTSRQLQQDGGRSTVRTPMIHIFIGTKAQYIKSAPLMRLMDAEGVSYRLIDSGQHALLSRRLRRELGVREPDVTLATERDINTLPQAVLWSLRLTLRLRSARRLRADVFGNRGGIVVVHGDTPSTFFSVLMAKRAGLRVAHLEAGLSSGNWRNPFPEELIRSAVHRTADVLFAPSDDAAAYLKARGVHGKVVQLADNTGQEALAWAVSDVPPASGPAVITMHRVENLYSRDRVRMFVETIVGLAREQALLFVAHGPTLNALEKSGDIDRIRRAGIGISPLLGHREFVAALLAAPFVITDGGSVQEECAAIGVPTLLWRSRTERSDGLNANVVLSGYDPQTINDFLADPSRYRRAPRLSDSVPSRVVLDTLMELTAKSDEKRRRATEPRTKG